MKNKIVVVVAVSLLVISTVFATLSLTKEDDRSVASTKFLNEASFKTLSSTKEVVIDESNMDIGEWFTTFLNTSHKQNLIGQFLSDTPDSYSAYVLGKITTMGLTRETTDEEFDVLFTKMLKEIQIDCKTAIAEKQESNQSEENKIREANKDSERKLDEVDIKQEAEAINNTDETTVDVTDEVAAEEQRIQDGLNKYYENEEKKTSSEPLTIEQVDKMIEDAPMSEIDSLKTQREILVAKSNDTMSSLTEEERIKYAIDHMSAEEKAKYNIASEKSVVTPKENQISLPAKAREINNREDLTDKAKRDLQDIMLTEIKGDRLGTVYFDRDTNKVLGVFEHGNTYNTFQSVQNTYDMKCGIDTVVINGTKSTIVEYIIAGDSDTMPTTDRFYGKLPMKEYYTLTSFSYTIDEYEMNGQLKK